MEKQSLAKVSQRLEPRDWRTTQRENRGDYEQRATAGKWGAILSAIINYQNKHHGLTPTDIMIAKDTRLSIGQVQYHLREMEKAGLIKDNKGWPRIIRVEQVAKVEDLTAMVPSRPEKVEEVEVMDTATMEGVVRRDSRGRRLTPKLGFMERAKQAAQAIMDSYDNRGRAPEVQEISAALGYAKSGAASDVIAKMAAHGWVHHSRKKHRDLALTGLGRDVLLNGGRREPARVNDFGAAPQSMAMALRRDTSREEPQVEAPPPEPTPAPRVRSGTDLLLELLGERGQKHDFSQVDDLDLVLEAKRRGFKVSR